MNKPKAKRNQPDPDLVSEDDAVIGRALKWSLVAIVSISAIVTVVIVVVNWPKPEVQGEETKIVEATVRDVKHIDVPRNIFRDATDDAGIHFVHVNGAYGDKLLPETMGGGVAFFNFDNDGDQDLLLINSSYWPERDREANHAVTTLYANDGTGKFTNVTAESGLHVSLYGMGVAIGDFDNDGWRDVFISAVGFNRLLQNKEGKFVDVTAAAGIAGDDQAWSTSCGWFDYDNDGLLDLFVCNYVDWNKEFDLSLGSTLDGENRAYGPPTHFEGAFPHLYHNDGDGKFSDVSETAGVQVKNRSTGVPLSKSLGVIFADIDADGFQDIVVANDTVQNLLFHNQKNGTFVEKGGRAGIAFNSMGNANGAMGIDAARFRNSEQLGLCIGNFATEPTSLYVTQGLEMLFSDEATATGLGPQTRLELTFGLFFFDYDLDGRLDIIAANGHLEEDINKIQSQQHYKQPPQLFWNAGPEEATEFVMVVKDKTGPDFHQPMVGRGAAFADVDNDGDLDVLITAVGGSPRLLLNERDNGNHWVRFQLIGSSCNRDAIGAWIELHAGGQVFHRQVAPTRSYLSQVELPVTIGIGQADTIDKAVVHWPGGQTQKLVDVKVDQLNTVKQAMN